MARTSPTGPEATSRPRRRIVTASQTASTSARRWLDRNTVVRPSAPRFRTSSRTSTMPAGSSPLVGSSRISSSGALSIAAAMASRWRIPSEYALTRSSARSVSPTSSSISSTRAPGRSANVARIRRLRRPEKVGNICGDSTSAPRRPTTEGSPRGICGTEHPDGPGVGGDQSHDDADRGRLARSVRSEEAVHSATRDGHRQVVDGDRRTASPQAPVGLADSFELDDHGGTLDRGAPRARQRAVRGARRPSAAPPDPAAPAGRAGPEVIDTASARAKTGAAGVTWAIGDVGRARRWTVDGSDSAPR